MMKKKLSVLSLMLAMAMVLGLLTACGQSGEGAQDAAAPAESASAPVEEASAEPEDNAPAPEAAPAEEASSAVEAAPEEAPVRSCVT